LFFGLALWTAGIASRRSAYGAPLRLAGSLTVPLAFVLGAVSELAHVGSEVNWSAHLDSLTLAALATWIAWESRWRRTLLYPASLVLLAALLWECHALGLRELQGYGVPVGMYFLLLGVVAGRDEHLSRHGSWLAPGAGSVAGRVFWVPTLLQTVGRRPVRAAVVLLAESFVLIVL